MAVFKPGEAYDPKKVVQLTKVLESKSALPGGPGVRTLRRPNGYIQSYRGTSSFSPPIWRVRMQGGKTDLKLTIGRGLVNGVEPVIGDPPVPISGRAASSESPALPVPNLLVPEAAFDEAGNSLLYLEAGFSKDWSLLKVTPVAFTKKPPVKAFAAYKLLGFILEGGQRFEQMCFHNLGLGTLFSRTTAGRARYVWYAV